MSTLRAIKKLVLGETWILPVGLAVVLLLSALLKQAAPAAWEDAGGALLAVGVLGVLVGSVLASTRRSRD